MKAWIGILLACVSIVMSPGLARSEGDAAEVLRKERASLVDRYVAIHTAAKGDRAFAIGGKTGGGILALASAYGPAAIASGPVGWIVGGSGFVLICYGYYREGRMMAKFRELDTIDARVRQIDRQLEGLASARPLVGNDESRSSDTRPAAGGGAETTTAGAGAPR